MSAILNSQKSRATSGKIVTVVTMLVLGVATTLFSAFLSVQACIGSEGAGVAANSVRGRACDVPAVGPWLYVVLVAFILLTLSCAALFRARSPRGLLLVALAPSVGIVLVPAFLALLPRR